MSGAGVLTVGLTGGVASGKSTVGYLWSTLGIPFYEADRWAIWLMEREACIVARLKELFGTDIYTPEGKLKRERMAELIFRDQELRREVEQVVHPAVKKHFREWSDKREAPYVLLESAIIFESGLHAELDCVVDVYAPEEVRRVRLSRVKISFVEERLHAQLDENYKTLHADFVILNDGRVPLTPQIYFIHMVLLKQSARPRDNLSRQ